ncbi:MAG: phosphopantetheinyl transferase [Caldilinea sp. CFX5]|nr:phosphopantetheinyl transferase [Caldilinea sp. CFX5]
MTLPWPFRTSRNVHNFALGDDDVQVWQVRLEQDATTLAHLHELLNAEEQQRAARFYFPADQRRYTVGRGVLRLLLGRYMHVAPTHVAFVYNPYGKPELAPLNGAPPLHFNLSHSGEMALYAFARQRPLGIDIERMKPDLAWRDLARQIFSPYEQQVLATLPVIEQLPAFYRGWTRKEAYIKARGMGLSLALDQFDVTLQANLPAQLLATRDNPQEATRWTLCDLPCPTGYAAALVVAGYGWHTTICH